MHLISRAIKEPVRYIPDLLKTRIFNFNNSIKLNVIPYMNKNLYFKTIDNKHIPLSIDFKGTLLDKNYKIIGVIDSGSKSTTYLTVNIIESEFSHRKYVAIVIASEAKNKRHNYYPIMGPQSQYKLCNTATIYDYFSTDKIIKPSDLYIRVQELVTPLNTFKMDKFQFKDKFYDATKYLYDEDWIVKDLSLGNMGIDIYGRLKFINPTSLVRRNKEVYMKEYGYMLENIDEVYDKTFKEYVKTYE